MAIRTICLLCAISYSCLAQMPDCGNFAFSVATPRSYASKYERGVFQIQCNSEYGTAFIIDKSMGFVITAKHCIKSRLSNPNDLIIGSSEYFSGTITLDIHSVSKNSDLAILKPADDQSLAKLQSSASVLDISFDAMSQGADGLVMGFRKGETKADIDDVKYNKIINNRYELIGMVYGGTSGGPLINSQGNVIGVCKATRDPGISATFIKMEELADLLSDLPLSERMTNLDRQFMDGSLDAEDIASIFRPSGDVNFHIYNLELFCWTMQILKRGRVPKKSRDVVHCLLKANIDRRIFIVPMSDGTANLNYGDFGRGILKDAITFKDAGQLDLAREYLQISKSFINRGINDYIRNESAEHIQGVNQINAIESYIDAATPESDYLAGLVLARATAEFHHAKLSTESERNSAFSDAAIYSLLSIELAETNSKEAQSYALLGGALNNLGEFTFAATAYSTSYQKGLQTDWVEGNFQAALSKSDGKDERDISEYVELSDEQRNLTRMKEVLRY